MLHKILKDYLAGENLNTDINCGRYIHYGLTVYQNGDGEEYAIGTDTEAQEACKEATKELAWAFCGSFMEHLTGIDDAVYKLLSHECENANDAVLSIIKSTCGLEKFVSAAISADGRGHFLSVYDGEEIEHQDHFIYRLN